MDLIRQIRSADRAECVLAFSRSGPRASGRTHSNQAGAFMPPVTLTIHDDIAHVEIDNPPVNALNRAVRAGLKDAAEKIEACDDVRLVILHCAGRTFVSGAFRGGS
ncbi:MAG: hypothetical protein COB97_01895 [Paracoccus sp.]|nr:MAG: hypothetical protein COB97_01895 [Paracoccus sp. (in: a-proteobacteria)]